MGISSELFTSKPDDNLVCGICLDIFEKPSALACQHTFCEACIQQHFRSSSSGECPTCRLVGNNTRAAAPSFVVRALLDNFEVRCRNNNHHTADHSCPWIGRLGDWPTHALNDCCHGIHRMQEVLNPQNLKSEIDNEDNGVGQGLNHDSEGSDETWEGTVLDLWDLDV